MTIPYVKIKVNGEVVGTLHLLGFDLNDGGKYTLLLSSFATINGFNFMCEGAFDSVVRLEDKNGRPGNVLIGKKRAGENPASAPFEENLQFMKYFANALGERVESQLKSHKERP